MDLTVLDLAEDDYRFGVGPMRLAVSAVYGVQMIDGERWADVQGMKLRRGGADPRRLLVRESVIRHALHQSADRDTLK